MPAPRGGFDVVIGNPPYIRIQTMQETAPQTLEYYKRRYAAAAKGNYDIYVLFVERGLQLLNPEGRLGFILPHKFFNAQYGRPLREHLSRHRCLAHIVHFSDQQVFDGATTYTCLLFLSGSPSQTVDFARIEDLNAWRASGGAQRSSLPAERFTADEWNITVGPAGALFERLKSMPTKLRDVAHLFVGLQTDADDVFIVEQLRAEGDRVLCRSKATGEEHWFEDAHLKPLLKGSLNVARYHLRDVNKRLVFPYTVEDGRSILIDPGEYRAKYPLTWKYLAQNKTRLAARNKGRMGSEWYGYVYKKNHTRFGNPKLLAPSLAKGSCFACDIEGRYYFVGSGGGGGGGYGILPDSNIDLYYLLGLLNSSLVSRYLRANSTTFRGGYIALNRQYIEQIPIVLADEMPGGVELQARVGALAQGMLTLHQRLEAARTTHDKAALQRQIDITDRQIDQLVYELYGLTDQEIRVVEESTALPVA